MSFMSEIDDLTHKIEIKISGVYPSGEKQHANICLYGEGNLKHMVEALKMAIIAGGFSLETAKKLDEIDV